ncbi:PaaI family thioesterase [Anaerolineae bacterium CFX9]|nr:PaaI family thioesterase [Anaerolineae bacterium CFX9]
MSERSVTVTWEDPMIGASAAREMAGIDYLNAIISGEIPFPPIARLFNIRLIKASAGHATFSGTPAEQFYNPIGSVQGGFYCTLLDASMGCAVHSMLPKGTGYATVDLHTYLVRPITLATGEVHSIGEVVHMGRKIATAQAKLVDSRGKLYAHATSSCIILSQEG